MNVCGTDSAVWVPVFMITLFVIGWLINTWLSVAHGSSSRPQVSLSEASGERYAMVSV